ncbi:MAG TPA: 2OG-Fe(II) oxygenase family protein [Allosphingosinicella sp.]|nr:2OG-Fe(II) oxygenase family protein [Allosphingosinicella sp.]
MATSPGPQAAAFFATPVIVDQMPGASELNRELKELILERQAADKGLEVSNVGGWHSDVHMLRWGGAAAMRLIERIIAAVDHFTVDVRSGGKPRYRWFPEMWANVSPPGALNQLHAHPGSFWSAVYYVDDGYGGSSDRELGGELVLLDPRMPMVQMNTPDLRFRRPGQPPEQAEQYLRPASGRIVIFPAWLGHYVRPYGGQGTRISVAANLSAVPLSVPSTTGGDSANA